jgi:L-ascorbate metabolism protein UlaG (beta-lactamase superfamily)
MEITYLGHSSFRIKGKKSIIVTDPYDQSVGFKMPRVTADIVTVSHHHHDHDYLAGVKGTTKSEVPFVIDGPGEYEVRGVSIFGIASYHDQSHGTQRGENTIYLITLDGLHLAHLGDLGHKLTEEQLVELNGVDILFIPVGGTFTIDARQAIEVIGQIEPSIVIPMHYLTQEMKPDFGIKLTVEDFLKALGEEKIKPQEKLEISKEKLPEEREIVIFRRKT